MAQRVFTSDDQLAFAKLSGDFNPLHLDPLLARRMVFGHQVVHGMHALLWSLENHLKSRTRPLELRTVKANFQAAIGVGQTVRCVVASRDENRVTIQLKTNSAPAVWIDISWGPLGQRRTDALPQMPVEPQKCRNRSIEEVAAASGNVALFLNGGLAGRLFPNLIRVLPPMQLGVLLATSRLVGMECPGQHSIYASLNLAFFPDSGPAASLDYRVSDCNQRLALAAMDVNGPGVSGQVKAFLRPSPQRQAAFADVCRQVEEEEFSAQQALIVGGSRGLGEVTAKLLAAGGAQVTLTYYRGEQDAQCIVDEMVSHGARADSFPLNVLEPSQTLPGRIAYCSKPLYLYYFATPPIFGAAKGKFSPERFATFNEYYVSGFFRTIQAVADLNLGLQKVFYPSSTAIDELPLDMAEYAAAKMAGEILCDYLSKVHSGLAIHKPRLPRIATDQTVSLLPVSNQEPVAVLLRNLRHLRQM